MRGATGSGNVAIGNGATAGICYLASVGTTIASYNTDIGNLGNSAVLVNVGFNGAGGPVGTVNIGRGATAVTIGNTAAGFKSAGPITLGTTPSSPTQIGFLYNPTVSTTIVSSGSTQASINIGAAGYYLFTFCLSWNTNLTLPTSFYTVLTGTNSTGTNYGSCAVNGQNLSCGGSVIINCTASTYSLSIQYGSATGTNVFQGPYFQALRIA